MRRLKDEATKLGFALSTALLPRNSPPSKSGVSSFAFQAPHAGAEKSHDFCYALSKHLHVAENVSFRSLEAERLSCALQAPRWMGKGAVRRRWKGLRGWGAVGEKGVFSRQQAALRESGSRLRAVHV